MKKNNIYLLIILLQILLSFYEVKSQTLLFSEDFSDVNNWSTQIYQGEGFFTADSFDGQSVATFFTSGSPGVVYTFKELPETIPAGSILKIRWYYESSGAYSNSENSDGGYIRFTNKIPSSEPSNDDIITTIFYAAEYPMRQWNEKEFEITEEIPAGNYIAIGGAVWPSSMTNHWDMIEIRSVESTYKNVALSSNGGIASAISEGTYLGNTEYAYNANDGNSNTGWSSQGDMPAWLEIEFDKVYTISKVGVWWGSHQHTFSISLSMDGTNWTVVVPSRLSINSEGDASLHEEFKISSMDAKFIRLDITTTSAPGSHIFQASAHELEAFQKTPISVGWSENFEDYSNGSFPSTWTPDGNATDNTQNYVDNSVQYSGDKSLHLFGTISGCWGALAYHPIEISPPFEIEITVRNGDEALSGCHPARGEVGLRQGSSWTNLERRFISFNDGVIYGGSDDFILGTFQSLSWYSIRVVYEQPDSNTIRLSYWLNNSFIGSQVLAAIDSETLLSNLQLVVQEGTAWFDDIIVKPTNQNSIDSTIDLAIPEIYANMGDTLTIPVNVNFPNGKFYDSAELSFNSKTNGLEFIGVDTSSTIIGSAGWTYTTNETDNLLLTAFSGADDITGFGVFCNLKFVVTASPCDFVPITIKSALFNTGGDSVSVSNGGVQIEPIPVYGDVDENGEVQAHDASLILKHLVGYDTLYCQSLANADVTIDSTVSALDVSIIQQYIVKLIDVLPYDSSMGNLSSSGEISMQDQSISSGGILEVSLFLVDGNNILSFDGEVSYDPEILVYQDIIWSDSLNDFSIEINSKNGKILFAGANSTADGHTGTFATLIFNVKDVGDGETEIVLNRLRFNEGPILTNSAIASILVGVNSNSNNLPKEYSLSSNYPNPFNPSTVLSYQLPERSSVTIEVFDILGNIVSKLVDKIQSAGVYEKTFEAGNLSSGIYFYVLTAQSTISEKHFRETGKMMLLK